MVERSDQSHVAAAVSESPAFVSVVRSFRLSVQSECCDSFDRLIATSCNLCTLKSSCVNEDSAVRLVGVLRGRCCTYFFFNILFRLLDRF